MAHAAVYVEINLTNPSAPSREKCQLLSLNIPSFKENRDVTPPPFGCWISKPEILCLHAYNDNLAGSLNDLRLTLSWWKDLKHVSSVFFVNWNTTLQFFLPQIESFQINLCDLLTFWAGSQSFSIFLQSSWGRSFNEKSPIPHIACRWVTKIILNFWF